MTTTKPIASLSLDLDNKWSYLKTHGSDGWKTYPSYLNLVVPRVLDFLAQRGLKITFFVVGQDAALDVNHAAIRSIDRAGHEIGNHSFKHEPWLHLYSEPEVETELAMAEESIADVTGNCPIGFRGPGYSLSSTVLQVLARRRYQYDCSTFPTFLGPAAKLFYFMKANLDKDEKKRRSVLFGKFRDGLQPLAPFRWRGETGSVLEIPVTTMPIFKLPVHISYLLYLCLYSRTLALSYFRTLLALCRATGTPLSLLLHPTDFLSVDEVPEMAFFPAMESSVESKLSVVGEVLDLMCERHRVVTMGEHAREVDRSGAARVRAVASYDKRARRMERI